MPVRSAPCCAKPNLLHLNALYDLCSNRYLDALIQPGRKENEFRAICQMADRVFVK